MPSDRAPRPRRTSSVVSLTDRPSAAPTHTPVRALTPARPVEVLPAGVLRTERLLLRPLSEDDRAEFIRVVRASRQHLERFSPLHLPDETDNQLFDRQLALTTEGEAAGKACRRIVLDRAGQIVGACNLNAIRRGLAWEGDANCWLAASAEGKGYATEGMIGLLKYAFADLPDGLGLHRVLAWMQSENIRSERMIERLGFQRGGPEKSFLHAGGRWALHEELVMTPESFAARPAR